MVVAGSDPFDMGQPLLQQSKNRDRIPDRIFFSIGKKILSGNLDKRGDQDFF